MNQNTAEELRRPDLMAARIMLFGSIAGAALWLLEFYVQDGNSLAWLLMLVTFPLLIGGVLRLLTWILKGFLTGRPAHPE